MKKIFFSIIFLLNYFISASNADPISREWIKAGSGGAGAFTNVMWDKDIENTVYGLSDVSGLFKSENSGDSWDWKNNGLNDNMLSSIDQCDANYDAFVISSNFGVWKSVDHCETWTNILNSIHVRTKSHQSVKFSHGSDLVIYEGDDSGNIRKTVDGGENWVTYTNPYGVTVIKTIAVSMDDSMLFVGTGFGMVIYNTSDMSVVSTPLFTGNDSDKINDISEIRCFNFSGNNFVVVSAGKALAISTDNGNSWSYSTTISDVSTDRWIDRFDVTVENGVLKYICQVRALNSYNNFYAVISYDSGMSWARKDIKGRATGDSINNPGDIWHYVFGSISSCVSIDPNNSSRLYLADPNGMYISTDDLDTMSEKIVGAQNQVLTDIQLAPDGQTIIASGMDVGILKTINNGTTWTSLVPNVVNNYDAGYAGHYWKFFINGTENDWKTGRATVVSTICPWGGVNGTTLADAYSVISNNSGSSWTMRKIADKSYSGMWGNGFMRSLSWTSDKSVIYAGMDGSDRGVYKSTNLGINWTRLGVQPGYTNGFYNGLAVDPTDNSGNKVMFASFGASGGSSPYYTSNGGASWDFLRNSTDSAQSALAYVKQVKYSPNGEYIYIGDGSGNLWRSTNPPSYGSFSILKHFIVDSTKLRSIDGITFDPRNPNRMFLSLIYSDYTGYFKSHIFVTSNLNAGTDAVWTDITGNFPINQGINSMVIAYNEGIKGFLYVATYGGGVLKLDLDDGLYGEAFSGLSLNGISIKN